MSRLIEARALFLFFEINKCMCLELIRVGGGACNTIVGLEFGLIYMNHLHYISRSIFIPSMLVAKVFLVKTLRALREHEFPTIWDNFDSSMNFRCAQVIFNVF